MVCLGGKSKKRTRKINIFYVPWIAMFCLIFYYIYIPICLTAKQWTLGGAATKPVYSSLNATSHRIIEVVSERNVRNHFAYSFVLLMRKQAHRLSDLPKDTLRASQLFFCNMDVAGKFLAFLSFWEIVIFS